jgi:hypothetical protein
MTHVLASAAYIRKEAFGVPSSLRAEHKQYSLVDEQVWALLQTPQTVESLHRAASARAESRATRVSRTNIEMMLEQLLDADLIELSPDS